MAGNHRPQRQKQCQGRLRCHPNLEAEGHHNVWGAGDGAAVPDLTQPGKLCGPSAQHAVRQAKVLGTNIALAYQGRGPKDYKHAYAGSVASLGLYKGVAEIYGIRLKGFPAWFMHRTYHMSRVPTFARKLQVVVDWTQAFFFRREIVSLWSMHEPFKEFAEAASPPATAPDTQSDTAPDTQSDTAPETQPAT